MDYILKIKKLMSIKKITQNELAKHIDKNRMTINNFLTRKTKLDVDTMLNIADALGVDVCVFFKDQEQSSKKIIGNNNFVGQGNATQTYNSNSNNVSANEELLKALKQTINDKQKIIDMLEKQVK